ncbi:MAG TPA: hypothetical protein VNI58_10385, partial [Mariprofundaceae bacterium]|nr:hypothetical protein [Mariprofundaceae bacterium]
EELNQLFQLVVGYLDKEKGYRPYVASDTRIYRVGRVNGPYPQSKSTEVVVRVYTSWVKIDDSLTIHVEQRGADSTISVDGLLTEIRKVIRQSWEGKMEVICVSDDCEGRP